jgi:phosphatidate cytidylyltransferase
MDANLNLRIGTALIALPLLVGLVGWSPPWMFSAALCVVMVAALHEFFAMAFPHHRRDQCGGVIFGLALSATVFLDEQIVSVSLGMLFVIGFSVYLVTAGELAERLHRLLFTLLGGIYAGFLFPHWVLLFRQPQGREWTFWVLAVVMIGDTVAYFVGRQFGVRKLAPQISPGKTIAGAWGYLAGAIVAGSAAAKFLFVQFSWTEILMLSVVVAILGQLGDLFESWVKRVFAVKDSGMLLPGHGGVLDRVDSLIFPAVFTSTYLRVFHP